ncbi:MAG: peptidase M16, partial [Mailhella sp.]|nr:peptidase M16 [Mailhella sp.]
GPDGRERIEEAAALLREAQQKPDSQEALSTVPSLGRADMPARNTIIPGRLSSGSGVTVLAHELDTTGIVYARLAFGLSAMPARLLPLLPLYARALTEMGTKRRGFVELGFDIAARTGGLGASPTVFTRLADGSPVPLLIVSSKCTEGNIGGMAALMEEILCEPDFSDRERFLQMVLEEKARMEQSVVPAGNALVRLRLGGGLSLAGRMNEEMGGVSALVRLRALPERIERDWSSVLADLNEIHGIVVRREGAVVDLTADAGLLSKSEPALSGIVLRLPEGTLPRAELALPVLPRGELLSAPTQVNYVGLGMKLGGAGYAYSGAHAVVLRHLRMGYLWDRVRVQGGAYGCSAAYSRSTGSFIFVSYRDPNVIATLDAYKGAAGYLAGLRLSEADITRAVVGAIGDMDHYMLPGAKGAAGFAQWLSGESDEERQRIREEMLGTGLKDFHDFAPHLERALQGAAPCVLGGADAAAVAAGEGWTETAVL